MKFDEFKILVKGLKAVYCEPWFLPDAEAIKTWYGLLGDLDYMVLNAAVQKYMLTHRENPKPADLRDMATSVSNGDDADWGKAWETVLKAIRNFGIYNEMAALKSFDELTRATVRRLGFKELCRSENIAVDRANFRKIYNQLSEQKHDTDVLSIDLQHMIAGIQERKALNECEKLPSAD